MPPTGHARGGADPCICWGTAAGDRPHKCLHNMLTVLRRVLQLDGGREYAKVAMLQDLLPKVFSGEMIGSSTIDAATGRVEVDKCMA
jgi:hypothetical protein